MERRMGVGITTFMVAKDPYLQEFVREFTKANNGRAFYSSLQGLGDYVFKDYVRVWAVRIASRSSGGNRRSSLTGRAVCGVL